MPKDLINSGTDLKYPLFHDQLMINPYRKDKLVKKKKNPVDEDTMVMHRRAYVAGDKSYQGDKTGWFLEMSPDCRYKVSEYGNYPLTKELKPRWGCYRMMLPCDADWEASEDSIKT